MKHLGRLIVLSVVVSLALAGTSSLAFAQVEDDLKEADEAFERGEMKRAAKAYDRAIRKYPGQVSPEAYGKRAAIYIITKDYTGGLQFVAQVAEPQHPGAPEILEQKALMLWALGSKPDAIEVAEEVVKKKPSSFTNQNIIGEFYAGREPDKAIAAYEAFFQNRPSELEKNDVMPRIRLGFAYLKKARFAEAEKQFDTLLQKHRKRPNAEVNANTGLCAAYTAQEKFDRAITLCERIIQNPKHIDRNGSVWYNLGQAYFQKKQPRRARTAANEYIRMRRNKPKGYILLGDSYFLERDWARALESYQKAEQLVKGGREAEDLASRLGSTYRRLGDLDKAVEKLAAAVQNNPGSASLSIELGTAYLDNRDDAKALATVERALKANSFRSDSEVEQARLASQRSRLLLIAAKSFYNRKKLDDARTRFQEAYTLRGKDVAVRRGLVLTINYQAYQAYQDNKLGQAETYLGEALKVDPRSAGTNQNMAVLMIQRGDCEGAKRYLRPLEGSRSSALMYHRLMGRALLCGKDKDPKRAAEHYAAAEKEAANSNLLRAEVYTEWAPLIVDDNLEDAVDKLQTAVQFSNRTKGVGEAAQRNLALALFRRGWKNLSAGRTSQAVQDFEYAARNPGLLKGTEPLAFDFSLALANLEAGKMNEAAKLFKDLESKGRQGAYLRAPYDKVGPEFFAAYARYRSGTAGLQRQAATDFAKLQRGARGKFEAELRELEASAWAHVAYDAYRAGKTGNANTALASAARNVSGRDKREIDHNRAVLAMGNRPSAKLLSDFRSMGATPPEALVNLGIMYDRAGQAREAYDAWVEARKRGAKSRNLAKWIAAKERIFGF